MVDSNQKPKNDTENDYKIKYFPMKDGLERRQYVRAPLKLDMVVETLEGPINGMTADLSISGLSIMLFRGTPEVEDTFKITIKLPNGHEMLITCQKVWSGKRMSDDLLFNSFGVRFINVSHTDRQILSSLIEDHYLVQDFKKYRL